MTALLTADGCRYPEAVLAFLVNREGLINSNDELFVLNV